MARAVQWRQHEDSWGRTYLANVSTGETRWLWSHYREIRSGRDCIVNYLSGERQYVNARNQHLCPAIPGVPKVPQNSQGSAPYAIDAKQLQPRPIAASANAGAPSPTAKKTQSRPIVANVGAGAPSTSAEMGVSAVLESISGKKDVPRIQTNEELTNYLIRRADVAQSEAKAAREEVLRREAKAREKEKMAELISSIAQQVKNGLYTDLDAALVHVKSAISRHNNSGIERNSANLAPKAVSQAPMPMPVAAAATAPAPMPTRTANISLPGKKRFKRLLLPPQEQTRQQQPSQYRLLNGPQEQRKQPPTHHGLQSRNREHKAQNPQLQRQLQESREQERNKLLQTLDRLQQKENKELQTLNRLEQEHNNRLRAQNRQRAEQNMQQQHTQVPHQHGPQEQNRQLHTQNHQLIIQKQRPQRIQGRQVPEQNKQLQLQQQQGQQNKESESRTETIDLVEQIQQQIQTVKEAVSKEEFVCTYADCGRHFMRKTALTNHLKAHENKNSRSIKHQKRMRSKNLNARRTQWQSGLPPAVPRMTSARLNSKNVDAGNSNSNNVTANGIAIRRKTVPVSPTGIRTPSSKSAVPPPSLHRNQHQQQYVQSCSMNLTPTAAGSNKRQRYTTVGNSEKTKRQRL